MEKYKVKGLAMDKSMTIVDVLEQRGIEKGIQQGIEQGIEQGIKTIVSKLLKKGMSIQEISGLTEVSEDFLAPLVEDEAS